MLGDPWGFGRAKPRDQVLHPLERGVLQNRIMRKLGLVALSMVVVALSTAALSYLGAGAVASII
jgi:hypothetical protein